VADGVVKSDVFSAVYGKVAVAFGVVLLVFVALLVIVVLIVGVCTCGVLISGKEKAGMLAVGFGIEIAFSVFPFWGIT
jgi:hypothetical protein